MPAATKDATTRRTQAERRASTRKALLEAATACLIEDGYAGFSTTEIVKRAGLSQGALFKHFPTKDEVLAATAEHLYEEMISRYVDRFRRLARKDEAARIDGSVRLLWQMFDSREMGAALELAVAARTDDELRRRLEPIVARHAERVRSVAASLFPQAVGGPSYDLTIDLVLELMLGMAVSRVVDRSPAHYRRLLAHISSLAHATLATAPDGHDTNP